MITDSLPTLPGEATMRQAIVQLAERRGIVMILDGNSRIAGVMTAGDLTRLMGHEPDVLHVVVADVMNRTPKVARPDELGSAVVHRMEEHGIMAMPVVADDESLVGVVHLHDLMRAGVA
jgi:arabinose-5-phosphate isomerase